MPCMDTFAEQDEAYRDSVLPPDVKARVAVEAASPFSWYRWVGDGGEIIGMTDFGASAPAPEVYEHFGITAEKVAEAAKRVDGLMQVDVAAHRGAGGPGRQRRRGGARGRRLRPHLAARRHAVGAGGHAGDRQPARLAARRRGHAGGARTRSTRFVEEVRGAGITDVVLLGMGGSSLAPEVYRLTNPDAAGLTLHVLDSTEPLQVLAVEDADRRRQDAVRRLLASRAGRSSPTASSSTSTACSPTAAHFIAITDPGTHMGDVATEHGFRRTFVNDPDIGGRYSALSYFGIVPAALAGVDVALRAERRRRRAARVRGRLRPVARLRARRARQRRPRQARLRLRPAATSPSACGSSS